MKKIDHNIIKYRSLKGKLTHTHPTSTPLNPHSHNNDNTHPYQHADHAQSWTGQDKARQDSHLLNSNFLPMNP